MAVESVSVLVCTDCFDRVGAKSALLFESRCLDPLSHEKSIEVRVSLTAKGVLEPEVRPTPKVHFKGEFVLCTREKCKGGPCTYPHCLKEKAAWNAEKFGFHLSGSALATTADSVSDVSNSHTVTELSQHGKLTPSPEPWPDFPGLGALSIEELKQSTSASAIQPVSKTPEVLPSHTMPNVQSPTKVEPSPRELNVQPSPRVPSRVQSPPKVPSSVGPSLPVQLSVQPPHTMPSGVGPSVPVQPPRWPSVQHPQTVPSSAQPPPRMSSSAQPPPRMPGSAQPPPRMPSSAQPPPRMPSSAQPPPRMPGSAQPPPRMPSSAQPPPRMPGSAQPPPRMPSSAQSPPRMPSSAQPPPRMPSSAQPPPRMPSSAQPPPSSAQPLSRMPRSTQFPPSGINVQSSSNTSAAEPLSRKAFHPAEVQVSSHQLPSYANVAALHLHSAGQRLPQANLSALPHNQNPQRTPSCGVAMRRKPPRQSSVIYQSLDVSNYHMKFRELLKLEEKAHAQLLKERCDGKYILHLLQSGHKPGELRVDAKPYHGRFGYFKGMDSDVVSYATQSASNAIIEVDNCGIQCDILRENNFHAEERLYVAFKKEAIEDLSHLHKGKNPYKSPRPLLIHFRLKYSYFRSLKEAIRQLTKAGIARILPKSSSFVPAMALDDTKFEPYRGYCSSDQLEALKVIASSPASGPPILITGPFGTGKTRVLAVAAHYFLDQSLQDDSRLRILVCTQQHTSADAYLDMYMNLTHREEPIAIIRLIPQNMWRNSSMKHLYKTVDNFKKEMERNSHRNLQRYLIVTTCLTAKQITDLLPPWFFTHIFLDEGAQMREPEAIAPLCMASQTTKIVIAGDKYQVGPRMLVLGEEPQVYGLSISLLERLYNHYCELGDVAKPYCAHLCTNFRCHQQILNLARQVAYKMPLECKVPDHSAHPDAEFPLRFVCTSLDARVEATESSINEDEVKAALKETADIFMKWPTIWGKRDLSQMCFLSPCRGQVTVARNTRKNLPPQVKLVRKVPTYQIQGQEFRALFISTSEPTASNGKTKDSTKSISDPSVFITALTRAQSLVVAVGNPFMLLKREKHMVEKYGDRGHCWSLFLKACLDNKSLSVPHSCRETSLEPLTKLVNQSVSHLNLMMFEPLRISTESEVAAPSIHVIPDTPTKSVPTSVPLSTEEVNVTAVHEFKKEHVMKEILGHGGFGVVCRVQHKIDKKEYALKIVRLPDKSDEQEKVMREVQALAHLEHPNIVRYYNSWKQQAPKNWKHVSPWNCLPTTQSTSFPSGSDRLSGGTESQAGALEASATTSPNVSSQSSVRSASEGSSEFVEFKESSSETQSQLGVLRSDSESIVCLCIKTELCDKATLKTWLTEHIRDRKRTQVMSFFVEILEAVKYMHSQGLMHRDLKPSNIFFSLAATESERKIKIGDFGLVTTSEAAVSEAAPPHSNYLGTKPYISPEQEKKEEYGNKVDVYALGIIYFEMNFPFVTGMERTKVLDTLRKRGSFPKGFENKWTHEASIIGQMLTEDPQNRPSAEAVAKSPALRNLKKSVKKTRDATI